MKTIYAALCVVGFLVPYYFIVSFLSSLGLPLFLLLRETETESETPKQGASV